MRKGSTGRAVAAVAVVTATVVVAAGTAWAHVTLHPGSLPKGASDALVSFAVPNERSDGIATTAVELDLPIDHPLLGVHAQASAGWTVKVETTKLAKPVTTDDGQITEAVSKVTWTATGAGIGQDEFAPFTLLVGTVPSDTSKLVFKTLQTYGDGQVVSWIEPIVKGTPEPEHPTPILKLTGKTKKKH